jgi:hypothetical protein
VNPIAIDPPDCACTECITGVYVPLVSATARQVTDMLAGRIGNNTGQEFAITAAGKFDSYPQRPFSLADADVVTVTTEARHRWGDSTYRWEIDPAALVGAEARQREEA